MRKTVSYSYVPARWLRETDLRTRSGLSAGAVVARVVQLRQRFVGEFSHWEITSNGLDNPYAQDHALATIAERLRQERSNRRHGITDLPQRAAAHIGAGRARRAFTPKARKPAAPVAPQPKVRPQPKIKPQRWQDAPEISVVPPARKVLPTPQKERKAA